MEFIAITISFISILISYVIYKDNRSFILKSEKPNLVITKTDVVIEGSHHSNTANIAIIYENIGKREALDVNISLFIFDENGKKRSKDLIKTVNHHPPMVKKTDIHTLTFSEHKIFYFYYLFSFKDSLDNSLKDVKYFLTLKSAKNKIVESKISEVELLKEKNKDLNL
ncbi:MAG: hypothetical protein HOE19_02760 [Candidatus Komeilibacteria bacterium]|jgi:hypothetical protein|nr:hypothetical protein [Candidatus Komeilibacteria bacterium]MBT4447175.1 hypothetical protein [Candidatus Komeilibacteria bacterium]